MVPENHMRVKLFMPEENLYVGSYHRIRYQFVADSKLKFEDLQFEVSGGAKGGFVSSSQDKTNIEMPNSVMLLVGYQPGAYELNVIDISTGTLVGSSTFTVDAIWRREEAGPTRWISNTNINNAVSTACADSVTAGLQKVRPAIGTRRIAILFVDTKSQRYTTNATTLAGQRKRWMDAIINGTLDQGITKSSREYFQEVSYGNFDLSADVFGPVHLPGNFEDYFHDDGLPKGGYYQACFTASDSLINFNNFDTLLCVSQPVDGPPRKGAWPYASIGNSGGTYTTSEGMKHYGVISMPNDWGTFDGTGKLWEAFSHELGHNLGLYDQYKPIIANRMLDGWDIMYHEASLPHFTLVHRILLGWVPHEWIKFYDLQSASAPVDETITLHPIEQGEPPAGSFSGIEIRNAANWSYFFEYRHGQPTQIGDRNLPSDNIVFGTDVLSPDSPSTTRPGVLLLEKNNGGSVLNTTQDYKELDSTDTTYPSKFQANVTAIDGNKADVRIQFVMRGRPDPSIRPWPAPNRPWQSPDIEVRNAKSDADAAWFNVPWVGNLNKIVAKVRNNGGADALNVRVDFYVKNFNAGGAPESYLGNVVKNVLKNEQVEFTVNWTPQSAGHYCISVRIQEYQLPGYPDIREVSTHNNHAQSNYTRFYSTTSSPPSREITTIEIGNPFTLRTRTWIVVNNSNPLYRTYLQHGWVWLDPGEVKNIGMMFEYAPDFLSNNMYSENSKLKYQELKDTPNNVEVTAYIENPFDNPRHEIQKLGGMQVQVVTGRSTKFESFYLEGGVINGTIVAVDQNEPVNGGKVILRHTHSDNTSTFDYQEVKLNNGKFAVQRKDLITEVKAFYIPSQGYGDCESDDLDVD